MQRFLLCVAVLVFIRISHSSCKDELQANAPHRTLVESVITSDGNTRFYIHYDTYGNLPDTTYLQRISSKFRIGDEIEVRYYPSFLFTLRDLHIQLVASDDLEQQGREAALLFPQDETDINTINIGTGEIYFQKLCTGTNYSYRLVETPTSDTVGTNYKFKNNESLKKDLEASKSIRVVDPSIIPEDLPNGYGIRYFNDVKFEKGTIYIEIYKKSPVSATLVVKSNPIEVMRRIDSVKLLHSVELSAVNRYEMQYSPIGNCYYANLSPDVIKEGFNYINILIDHAEGSWTMRQAPTEGNADMLKHNYDTLRVVKEKQLPDNLRIRPGFGVFNEGRDVRLISNFVFICSPERYFSPHTPFRNRLNPCIGLQIGGTQDQDVVFLMGLSFKLIEQADYTFGLRFGLNPDEPWKLWGNYFFGSSIDPALFKAFKGDSK